MGRARQAALAFDGRSLAFRTGGCGYAGPVGAWESRLPPGPCVRSEAGVDTELELRRIVARVACINAPAELPRRRPSCGLARARSPGGRAPAWREAARGG